MEPGGSMLHSQGLSNNSYPEPNQPNYPPDEGCQLKVTFYLSFFIVICTLQQCLLSVARYVPFSFLLLTHFYHYKQHSVPITAEEAQHRAKWLSVKINQASCCE